MLPIQDPALGLKRSGSHPNDSFSKWLRDLCGYFVKVVDDYLYFVHQTAREFLIGEKGHQVTVGWKGSF